jgi:1-acyl-sn-glycerol-3-phosphate acyltransferase
MRELVLRMWFLLVVKPIVRLLIGVSVHGREHLAQVGARPAVIVANHNSHLDAAVLMGLLRLRVLPQVRPVAAADYFERSRVRRFIATCCMNALLIPRTNITKSNNPLTLMVEALDAGQSLILFPEGTRGDPERMSTLQTGIAHLLRHRPSTPIIPVYLRNLGYALPRGELILVPMFCDVFVGPPRVMGEGREQIMSALAAAFDDLRAEAERRRPSTAPHDDR